MSSFFLCLSFPGWRMRMRTPGIFWAIKIHIIQNSNELQWEKTHPVNSWRWGRRSLSLWGPSRTFPTLWLSLGVPPGMSPWQWGWGNLISCSWGASPGEEGPNLFPKFLSPPPKPAACRDEGGGGIAEGFGRWRRRFRGRDEHSKGKGGNVVGWE